MLSALIRITFFQDIGATMTSNTFIAEATSTSNFQPIRLLDQGCCYKFTYLMANSADPDQLPSSEAN